MKLGRPHDRRYYGCCSNLCYSDRNKRFPWVAEYELSNPPLTPAVFHILLGLADGPRHGYAVMKAAAETGAGLSWGPGTVYGTLQRMEDVGLVRGADPSEVDDADASDGRGRPRRYFVLTEAGVVALRAEASRLERLAALTRSKKAFGRGDSR